MLLRPYRRQGMTLIELMVAIAVIAVTLAILITALGAINRGRGNSRRVECINNLRHLGLALQQHINAKNVFPDAATIGEDPAGFANDPPIPADSWIAREMLVPGAGPNGRTAPFRWGKEDGTGGVDTGPLYSWVVELLPGLDQQPLYNDFNRSRSYLDAGRTGDDATRPWNITIGNGFIKSLTCPDDDTTLPGQGNLSYACNLGFSLWWGGPGGWVGSPKGGVIGGHALDWGIAANKKTGLMTVRTREGTYPWDATPHTASSITDGMNTTIAFSENVFGGASTGNRMTGGQPTNWATAHPSFVGFMASDDICGPKGACSGRRLAIGQVRGITADGPDWKLASQPGSFENINFGANNLTDEGGSPFINSRHPGGFVVVMCDGSTRFIRETIDGTVFSKLVTPQGQSLPASYRQLPIAAESY